MPASYSDPPGKYGVSRPWLKRLRFPALFLAVLILAAGLRVANLEHGLPEVIHPDEPSIVLPALRIADITRFDPDPGFYHYPALPIYLHSLVFYSAGAFFSPSGEISRPELPDENTAIAMGRWLTTLFGWATVGVVFAIGCLARSKNVGLLAALFLAVMPFHAMDSHYANVDIFMTLWGALAFALAVGFVRWGGTRRYLAAAICIGLAAASKYQAVLMIGILPVALLFRRGSGTWERGFTLLIISGAMLAVASFLITAPYTILEFDGFLQAMGQEMQHQAEGHWGWDLNPGGWLYTRGVYQLLAGMPFLLGLPLHLAVLAGIIWMALRRDRHILLLAAAAGPLFVVVCTSNLVFPRYWLPLTPFLVMPAALMVDGMLSHGTRRSFRWFGVIILLIILAHNLAVTVSQLGLLEPPNATLASRWIVKNIPPGSEVARSGATRDLKIPSGTYRVGRFNVQRFLGGAPAPEWLVVSSWYEDAFARGSYKFGAENRFLKSLGSPGSDYELAKKFESKYIFESFYAALDPNFGNQFQCPDYAIYRKRTGATHRARPVH